jgi:hypothetical protein
MQGFSREISAGPICGACVTAGCEGWGLVLDQLARLHLEGPG